MTGIRKLNIKIYSKTTKFLLLFSFSFFSIMVKVKLRKFIKLISLFIYGLASNMVFQFTVYNDFDGRVHLTFCQCQTCLNPTLKPFSLTHHFIFYIKRNPKSVFKFGPKIGVQEGPIKPKQFQLQFVQNDKSTTRQSTPAVFIYFLIFCNNPSLSPCLLLSPIANFELFSWPKVLRIQEKPNQDRGNPIWN